MEIKWRVVHSERYTMRDELLHAKMEEEHGKTATVIVRSGGRIGNPTRCMIRVIVVGGMYRTGYARYESIWR